MDLTVTNLVITADTVLDFSGLDSRIFATNLSFLSTDITLNIINWTWAQDYFYATNFLGGTYDTRYLQPMTQIVFNSPTYTGDNTYWDSFDDQIYPVVPEPSTYGAIFTALAAALFLLRKKLRKKQA
ncbi:MAG: hypothetical protein RIS54_795 [Verrucomicrobiota bacterium]|jgi:hypothetical protein